MAELVKTTKDFEVLGAQIWSSVIELA